MQAHVSREGCITEKASPCCQWPCGHTEVCEAFEARDSQVGDSRTCKLQRPGAACPQPAPVTQTRPLTGGTESGARWAAGVQRGLGLVLWPAAAGADQRPVSPYPRCLEHCDIYFWPFHTSCDGTEPSTKEFCFLPCERMPM